MVPGVALHQEAGLLLVLLIEKYRCGSFKNCLLLSMVVNGDSDVSVARCIVLYTAQQRYVEAAKVHAEVQGLRDCMRKHFPVVRSHVAAEVETKIAETGESLSSNSPMCYCIVMYVWTCVWIPGRPVISR